MTTPSRYQPETRLIDNPDRLHELYHEQNKSVRAIAANHAEVSSTRVYEALEEHDVITDQPEQSVQADSSVSDGRRGKNPPVQLDWSTAQ